jgi:formylmethanofuran dehydrogenase subunit E
MVKAESDTLEDRFRDFLLDTEPIRFKDPLAETLGVFKRKNAVLEYTFLDVVKLAGHACPTTAAAYLCCQKALIELYSDEIPTRGEIAITIYGEPDEGVYGVISQIFTLLTGAASATGFRGLGPKFKRKDLLKFSPEKIDPGAQCFKFQRLDNKKTVTVKLYPDKIPFPAEKAKRLQALMPKVIWEAAKKDERLEFQDLWMEKVRDMLVGKKDIDKWLKFAEMGA